MSFNTSYVSVQVTEMCVHCTSALSFNTSYVSVQVAYHLYASSAPAACFNTSYVSVQVSYGREFCNFNSVSIHPMCRFKSIKGLLEVEVIIVSIHPMCRFKFSEFEAEVTYFEFQYILCVGSRHLL